MNQIGTYNPNDVHHSNMATTHAHPPSSGPMGGHYSQYPAPIMPSHSPYTTQYQSYAYSPAYSGAPVSSSMSHHNIVAMQSAPTQALPGTQNYIGHTLDTTGQLAPPGVKPRVTATLWEDEGTLCFQVEAKGVCVARREDNHMINGTKLLNVAGMTRGRRDGILKSEKLRHVVKIGPMHLKGVWIPFERALDFANKEKITENLYPLFVHDIGALLYHPQNNTSQRTGTGTGMGGTQSALAAYERRRNEQRMNMPPQTPSQAPAMHPLVGPVPNGTAAPRPGMDRASTFPTPPTSASSVVVNPQGSPYEYSMQPNGQPLAIDTNISNQRSIPNTPASTPPGKATHGSAVYSASQSYDPARPVYSNVAPSGQYQQQRVHQFGGPLPPPSSYKKEDHEHQDYQHSTNQYVPSQSAYAYNPNSAAASHPSPQQNDSGRLTPRTSTSQIYQYPAPQRSNTAPVSNVYNVVEPRDAANGLESHYYSATNGVSTKRAREDDDDVEDAKRQKVEPEDGGPVGGSPYPSMNASRPIANARKAR